MKTAIVLGGTHDHKYLIKLLKQKEYYVILIDYLENPPAKVDADVFIQESILDKELVLKIAKEIGAELVIATCIDQALETSSYVSEKLGLPCHLNYLTALNLTNKKHMKTLMFEKNIPTSNFKILNDEKEIPVIKNLKLPLVIKPVDANSSKGVYKINDINEVSNFFTKSLIFSKTGEVIVEEFVEGKELSVDVFIENYKPKVLLITENVKSKVNPQAFTISESIYNNDLEIKVISKIAKIAEKITNALHISNGPLLIQCIYNEREDLINVIEFSSRIGGGSKFFYIKYMTDIDILDIFIDTILGISRSISNVRNKHKNAKIKYLYTHEGTISEYLNFEELKNSGVLSEYFIYKDIGSYVGESSKSTDRCSGILIASDNLLNLKQKEIQCLNSVQVLNEKKENILYIL